jgi:hypothetical protein
MSTSAPRASFLRLGRQPLLAGWLLAVSTQASIIPYSPDAQTALLLHFDEAVGATSAADVSGNGLDLTAATSPFSGAPGPTGLGGAGTFTEGVGARHLTRTPSVGELALFSTTAFTIEAWVRNPDQANSGGTDDHDGIFQLRNSNLNRVELTILDFANGANRGRLRLAFNRQDNGNFAFADTPVLTWERDVWYHVAVTYDSHTGAANDSIVRYFVDRADDFDGVPNLVHTVPGVSDLAPLTSGAVLRVGGFDGIDNRSFGGQVDELRYSNVVRDTFHLAVVPEPSTLSLLVAGAGLLRRRHR